LDNSGTGRAFDPDYGTKDAAEAAGRDAAQAGKVEPVIKNHDGKIGSKNSYGNDPCVGLPRVLVGWAALVQPYSLLRHLTAVLGFPLGLAGVAKVIRARGSRQRE
jgi:hypothetical protein